MKFHHPLTPVLFLACCTSTSMAQAAATTLDQSQCTQLRNVQLYNTSIDRVKWVQKGGLPLDPDSAMTGASTRTYSAGEHCVVRGRLEARTGADGKDYSTQFEIRLPADWNQRMLFQGGGGTNGFVADAIGRIPFQGSSARPALLRGYAVITTDTGHQGRDTSFGRDQQARLDYAYAAIGKVVAVARQLVAQSYQQQPEHSFYMGCSNGGREAMMAAMRYPLEFDGVIAGNPGFRLSRAAVAQSWDNQQFMKVAPVNDKGEKIFADALTDKDLDAVANGVLNRCDALDGLKDGIVNAWERCDFKPEMVEKDIGPDKVALLNAVFGGPKDSKGNAIYNSWPYDAGINTINWRMWKLGTSQTAEPNALNTTLGATSLPHYFMTPYQEKFDTFSFDFDKDVSRTLQVGAINDADSTDLSTFKARGGKMLIIEGVSDPVFSAHDLRDWFLRLQEDTRGTKDFAQLYMVPGMAHCGGGNALEDFDPLTALESWVESDKAPTHIEAHGGKAFPDKSMPLCPYPSVAIYKGGSPDKAESFICK